jgi:hypothetical protein
MILATLGGFGLYWHLPILVVLISLVYSATRFDPWGAICWEAFRWGLRMGAFLGGIGLVLFLLATFM